jgi:TolB-like protein/Flp pilus assembly protein TadD
LPGPDIFLSYNREDAGVAKVFADAFAREGLEVWWDQTLRSGETYDEVTESALRGAKAVVVLWSPRSVASHWVRAEATIAHRAKTLVPATIEPCDKPVMFELTQTAELSHWRGEAGDAAWRAFLGDVRRMAGATENTAAPVRHPALGADSAHQSRPTVAVLPFVNRSGRSEDEAFADELVEDVTVALSLNPWLGVVAASITSAFRQSERDLRWIGRELDARYILEGNMRRAGDCMRVTAQLIEAESGKVMWTRRFERPVDELGPLQDELTTEVASHLSVQVERAETDSALKRPESQTAWEAFVRAVAYQSRWTRAGFEASIREAMRAIEIDPSYGLAYAVMASSQANIWRLRGGDDQGQMQEVIGHVRRARTLDPENPAVLSAGAHALCALGRPYEAMPLARRALAINPNLDFARAPIGYVLIMLGQLEEGIAELEAAERLGPNSVWGGLSSVWRSVAHMQAGRLDRAREAADEALFAVPGSVEAMIQNMLCQATAGEWDAARDLMRRMRGEVDEMSCTIAEQFARYLHIASPVIDDYATIVGKLWAETGCDK